MTNLKTQISGRAGIITLDRPKALNALTHDMCLAITAALDEWREHPGVDLVILEGAGERAFCAGGDIAEIYRQGLEGDFEPGRQFWRDEYVMNAALAEYPKPIISFMHGFVMGGGVGLAGHVRHRVVGESAQIAMPECGIGFVPDVGGTLLLARAPGRLGEHLGLTSTRMGPGDAIYAGFADLHVPEADWPLLKERLAETGETSALGEASAPTAPGPLAEAAPLIDQIYATRELPDILAAAKASDTPAGETAHKALSRNSALSMAMTLKLIAAMRAPGTDIRSALRQEYRVAHRIAQQGDFLEGVRAQIIDKDRNPQWQRNIDTLDPAEVDALLAPLGEDELAL